MWCYARVLAHYPYVVITAVLLVSLTCLIVTVTTGDKLSFEEPTAGFEPRGTEISDRLTAYNNLLDDSSVSSSPSPPRKQEAVVQSPDNRLMYYNNADKQTDVHTLRNTTGAANKIRRKRRRRNFFCDVPNGHWMKIVYHSPEKKDLFTLANIRSMCRLEQTYVTSRPLYDRYCLRSPTARDACCRTLSLANYIALLNNKPSCSNITEADVLNVKNLVSTCVNFYKNFTLKQDCDERHSPFGETYRPCRGIPKRCRKFNAVYNIIHFLSDHTFQQTDSKLNYAISFFPISFQSTTSQKLEDGIQLYLDIESNVKRSGNVEVIAADFGIKDQLFHHYLSHDTKWITLSAVFVFIIVWIFTGSIFVTVMTFVTIFWSLELAYFLYVFVFEIGFFPYMNLVTVLMTLAIGADDVFLYSKIWHLAKKERNNGTIQKLVSDTLKHATLSMFVTSTTTAGALFANIVSPITSVKCFSIYAGITMICNLILMVTWTPAVIVIEEKWCNCCFVNSPKIYKRLRGHYRSFFERMLPRCVIQLRFVWILLLGGVGILSGVLVFHYPKLRLPTSFSVQMFTSDHLMEKYDQELRHNFWFERAVGENRPLMPVTIVWGIHQVDNGNKLNPHDKGIVQYDGTFNPATQQAQVWLRQFCRSIRETDFYQKVTPFEIRNCYIEHFIQHMKQNCSKDNPLCCRRNSFPYTEHVFRTCLNNYLRVLNTGYNVWEKSMPGIKFIGKNIVALVVQFSSNLTYSYDYETVGAFYRKVNKWVNHQLTSAPREMRNGWFISELKFYSIQKSLAEGLPVAFGISIFVATAVTFFTSLNVLISLYAMVTISCIMLVTTASIVLLGWELNVLECVIITVAVGLSIDHTLHYGVAYRLAPDLDRYNRVCSSLVRVGSVVFMAALTTFIAGLFMLPSVTLVYQKFGIFLMLVISISWTYSTLFFQSLLNVIGPQGGFGQFHWPSLDCCSLAPISHIDRTMYTMSESTTSSSAGYPHHPSIDTNATEHDYLPERGSDGGTPHHRQRLGRYYPRPKCESVSPDNQSERKLLNGGGDDKRPSSCGGVGEEGCGCVVEAHDALHPMDKLCTEV